MKRIAAAIGHATSWVALSPSLIPRTWWMTAINVGINAYGGQKIGETAHAIAHLLRERNYQEPLSTLAESYKRAHRAPELNFQRNTALLSLALAGSVFALRRSMKEQADISRRTGLHKDPAVEQLVGYLVGGIGWIGLDLLTLGTNRLRRFIEDRLSTRMPYIPEVVVTAASISLIVFSSRRLLTTVLYRIADGAVRTDFARPSLAKRPKEPQRTGSRFSPEPFSTLGYHGREFVSAGPRKVRIERIRKTTSTKEAKARTVKEPIRVFIGRLAHPDLVDAAQAAVAELERTGAFDREALLLVTNTGSGWIPQWSVCAFEYLTGGNCATAAIQYSFAGSWLAFLIHREQAKMASKLLLEAIEAQLAARERAYPSTHRPKIYVTGESLGALGGHGAFYSLEDMRRRIDGALWTGTPRTTPLVDKLFKARNRLTFEVRPLIGRGSYVRFVGKPKHMRESPLGAYAEWDGPRIIYAQHSSDPVVWWSPSLLYKQPDWLREPRGKDVSPSMTWYPWVTFWQLLADMPRSVQLPGGHGHNYHREVVHYWNEILDTGFSKKDCNRIGDAIAVDLDAKSGSLSITDPPPWHEVEHQNTLGSVTTAIVSGLYHRIKGAFIANLTPVRHTAR